MCHKCKLKHKHNCKHTNVKYCKECDFAYCEDCGYEWKKEVITKTEILEVPVKLPPTPQRYWEITWDTNPEHPLDRNRYFC